MGMAVLLGFWALWTLSTAGCAWVLWRFMQSHRKVYVLIVVHAVYVAGTFLLYHMGLSRGWL